MAFWGNDTGIILDDNGVVDCETCPCGISCCFDDAIPDTLPAVLSGPITQVTCANCPSTPTLPDAVFSGGCQWLSNEYDPGFPCGLAAVNAIFEASSDTECTIVATVALGFDSGPGAFCGGVCEIANYIGTFASNDPGPWVLNYDSGFAGVCDLSGTTLTLG